MILESIEAHHFRNLSGTILWNRGLNIICGDNGQGKTNWLESIYVLSRTKSFRTQRLQESIKFSQQEAFIRGTVSHGQEVSRELQVTLQGSAKVISINGKKEPLARYLSQLQVFAFTADELEVIRGAPDARRRFIDRGVCSLQPAFVQTLSDYNRVLKQKNRILQDAGELELSLTEVDDLLEPWNQQLVKLAAQIHHARADYVQHLNQALERRLFDREEIQIRYVSSFESKGDLRNYESLLSERLRVRLEAEVAAGRALIGPHRDDLEVLFEGREMRVFGSSGQQRSALLLLDLAAISVYNSHHVDYPIFLIDDVDAELDEKRINKLLEYLEGRTQTFVTTSKRSHLQGFLSRASVYEIEEGKLANNFLKAAI
ncbi:MAG TPA: DNA replication and repair protein RecF [Pyrinomonadaceae bacterium]|nr:DNA replication and repair protein RecF [Pyrinomonadaceae bacterium]